MAAPLRRGDDSDAARKARQRPFALGAEQPLGGQLLLELLEGQLQRAQALRLEQFHQQLVFAARFVNVDAAARQHRQAVLRLELPVAVRGAEGHALHLRVALLEGEIVVAAGGQLQPGDLARNPDVRKLRVEQPREWPRSARSTVKMRRSGARSNSSANCSTESPTEVMVARRVGAPGGHYFNRITSTASTRSWPRIPDAKSTDSCGSVSVWPCAYDGISSPSRGAVPPFRLMILSKALKSARACRSMKNLAVWSAETFSATAVATNWLTLVRSSRLKRSTASLSERGGRKGYVRVSFIV